MRTKKGLTPYRDCTPCGDFVSLREQYTFRIPKTNAQGLAEASHASFTQSSHNLSRGPVKPPRGFTLIELLVVIAIIGILSSVVLASLNTARQKGRDAQRISDVRQIQLGLEFYYDAQNPNGYPILATSGAIPSTLAPTYLPSIPAEPVTGRQAYQYRATTATTYCVGVQLEGANIPTNNIAACVPGGTSANVLGGTVNYARSP